MTTRDVSSRLALAVVWAIAGCYDVPKPACGFRCGPSAACPADYTCAADGRCHLNGSAPSLVCAPPDAAPPDAYSPAVVATDPVAGATIDPSTPIRVTFDVDVAGVSLASFLVGVTGTSMLVPGSVTYDPPAHRATFHAAEGLPPNSQLTVTLTSDITASLRPLMPTTFELSTGDDTTAPTVVLALPPDGTTGVAVDTTVSFAFSEPVTGADGTAITLVEMATMTPVTATVTYDGPTRTATLDPQDQLTPNLAYVATAAAGVTDLAGNPLVPVAVGFTTGADAVAPTVRVTVPADTDTGVAVGSDIVVTFDEPVANVDTTSFQVNAGAVTGTVTMSNGNRTATFDPDADLPAASTITVTLSTAITDTSSNPLAAFTFAFTTN